MSEEKPASKRGSKPALMDKEVERVASFIEKLIDENRPIAKPVLTRFLGAYLQKYPRPRKQSSQNGLSSVWVDSFFKKKPALKQRLESYGKNVISLLGEVDWNVINALEKEFIEFVSAVLTDEDVELFRLQLLEKEQSKKPAFRKSSIERRSRSVSAKRAESTDVPSTSGISRSSRSTARDDDGPSTSGISDRSSSCSSVQPLKLHFTAIKDSETETIGYQVKNEETAGTSQAAETSDDQVKDAPALGSAKKKQAVKNTRSSMPVSPGPSPKKLRRKEPRTPVSSKERDAQPASANTSTPAAVKKTAVVALTPVVPRVISSGDAAPTPPSSSGKKLKQRAVPHDAVPQVPIVWEKGAPLEAFDVDGFYRAKIVEINDTHVTVHFDGWSKTRNKKFPRDSDLLRGMSVNMKFKVHDKVVVRTPGHGGEFYGYVYSTPFSGSYLQIYNVMAGRDQRVHHDHVTKMDEESWNRSVQKITNDKKKEKEAAEEAARLRNEAAGESGAGSFNAPSSSSGSGRSYQTGANSRRAKRTSTNKNEDVSLSSSIRPAKRARSLSVAALSSTKVTTPKVATPERRKNTAKVATSTQTETQPNQRQQRMLQACEAVVNTDQTIKQVSEKYNLSEESVVNAIDTTWGGVMKGDESDIGKIDETARKFLHDTLLHELDNGWKFYDKCAAKRFENHLRSRFVPVHYFFSSDLPMNRPTEEFIKVFRIIHGVPAAEENPFPEDASDMERAKKFVEAVNREANVCGSKKDEVFYLDEIRAVLSKRKNFVYRNKQFSVEKNEEIIALTLVGIDGSSYPPMLIFPASANRNIKFKKKDDDKLMFAGQEGNLTFQNIKNFLLHRVKYPGTERGLVVICDTTLDALEGNDHAGTFCRQVRFIKLDPALQDKFETRNQNFIGRLGLRWKNAILSRYLNKSDTINTFSMWENYNQLFTAKAQTDSIRESFKLSGLYYTNDRDLEGREWIDDLIIKQFENKPVLKGMKIKLKPRNAASTSAVAAPDNDVEENKYTDNEDAASEQLSPEEAEAERAVLHQKPLTPIKINTASLNIQTPTDDEDGDDDVDDESPVIERHTFEDFVHHLPSSPDDSLSASLKTKKTKKQTATAEDEPYSGHVFKKGDRVSARWNDGAFYPAYVVEVLNEVQCKVLYDDNRLKAQPMRNIRLRDESIETPLRIRKKDEIKCEKRRQKYLPEIFGDGTPVVDNRKRAEKPSSSQAQGASTASSSAKSAGPKESLATRKSSRTKTSVSDNPHRQGIKLKLQLNLSSASTVNKAVDNNLNNDGEKLSTSSSVYKLKSADGGGGAEASPMILMGRMHDDEGGEEDDDTMESLNVSSASSFSSPAQAGGGSGDEIDENTFNIESDVDAEEYVAQSDEEADDDHRISDDSDEPKSFDDQTATTTGSSGHKYKLDEQVVFCQNGSEDLSKVVGLLPNLRYQLVTSEQKMVSARQSDLKPLTEIGSGEAASTIRRPKTIPPSPLIPAYTPLKHHNFFDDKPSPHFKCTDCPKQYRKQSQLDQHRKVAHKTATKSNKDSAKKRPHSIVEAKEDAAASHVVSPPAKRKRGRPSLQPAHTTLVSPPRSQHTSRVVVADRSEADAGSVEPQLTTTTTPVQPARSQALEETDPQKEATTAAVVAEKIDEASPPSSEATTESEKQEESSVESEHLLCECGDETNGGEMIQCDRCLVWKHYGCAGLSEQQFEQLAASDTEKFVCRTCRYPRGERQTQRLSWDMELLVEGNVPSFREDGTKPKEDTSATGGIARSEFIAAYTVLINRDLELQADLERLNRVRLRMQQKGDTVDELFLLVNYFTNGNDCTSFTASHFPPEYLQNISDLTGVPVENLDVNAYKRRLEEMKPKRASFGRYNMNVRESYKGPKVDFLPEFQRGDQVQKILGELFYVYLRAHIADMCNSWLKDYVKNMKQLDEYSKIVMAAEAVGREEQANVVEDRASINRRLAETIDRLRRFTESHAQSA